MAEPTPERVTDPTQTQAVNGHQVESAHQVPMTVEVSRSDALSLGIAAEAYRKLGLEPPDWMAQAEALVESSSAETGEPENLMHQWRRRLRSRTASSHARSHTGDAAHMAQEPPASTRDTLGS
jgi:transcription elongation factor